jgi:hypothetical protein
MLPATPEGKVSRSANTIRHASTHTATWADFDLDGWADVYVGNERDNWVKNQPCQLFRNNRDGTFTDIAAAAGVSSCGMDTHGDAGASMPGFVSKGAAVGDYNNDGRPDLYISNLASPTRSTATTARGGSPRSPRPRAPTSAATPSRPGSSTTTTTACSTSWPPATARLAQGESVIK